MCPCAIGLTRTHAMGCNILACICYLKFTFHWASCISPGNPTPWAHRVHFCLSLCSRLHPCLRCSHLSLHPPRASPSNAQCLCGSRAPYLVVIIDIGNLVPYIRCLISDLIPFFKVMLLLSKVEIVLEVRTLNQYTLGVGGWCEGR